MATMRNPLYRRKVRALFDDFWLLDSVLTEIAANDLRIQEARAVDLFHLATEMCQRADTVPLPKSVIPAALSLGDAAWLLAELCRFWEGEYVEKGPVAVTEKISKRDESWGLDTTVRLDEGLFVRVLDYREKVFELLAKPAALYHLSLDEGPHYSIAL
ncbi:MAG: hypothetical protein LBJ07_04345 [Actinomycetes bacterium]|jgi:hypothetical protein|nr:hypothetical protein [Actinomycetes bacterium]